MTSEPGPVRSNNPVLSKQPEVLFRGVRSGLDRSAIRNFSENLVRKAAPGASFTCLITSDQVLRALNAQFLGHDYATDVLSFPSEKPDGSLGEIAISLPRAVAQAAEFGHSPEQEVCLLMLHGLLHLLGYDHETDQGKMRRLEARLRRALGLPGTLLQRTVRQ